MNIRITKSPWPGLGAFAFAAALALCSLRSTGWAAGLPKVVVPARHYDFGIVTQGEKVSHCFELGNRGTAPLKTSRMELSLPAMTARATASIAPGKTGQ